MRVIWIVLITFTFAFLHQGKSNLYVFTKRFKFLSFEFLIFCVDVFAQEVTELARIGNKSKSSGRGNNGFLKR